MGSRVVSRKTGESRSMTKHLSVEKSRRSHSNSNKEMAPLKACKQLLKSDDWESSKFSLIPKSSAKKSGELKSASSKELKAKHSFPKNREKVVIVSKKSSSVRVVKSGSQKCMKGVQRSVSVKKVSYSTSVILSSEDDESDSEEDDDDDDDDDDEEEEEDGRERSKPSSRKKDTVIKRTMSKIQTNYRDVKKVDCRSAKKAKALKMLREKSSKKKVNMSSRELRPRFPYSPNQEWPTARAHRMASLNALAKVHVLYENEGRAAGDAEDNSVHEILDEDSSSCDSKSTRDSKDKSKEESKNNTSAKRKKKNEPKPKVIKRRRSGEVPCDIEIIDTRMCKRMASLNAQAILAASYMCEKPKRREKVKKENDIKVSPDLTEIKDEVADIPDLQIVDSQKKESSPSHSSDSSQGSVVEAETIVENSPKSAESTESTSCPSSNQAYESEEQGKSPFTEFVVDKNQLEVPSNSIKASSSTVASASVSEVGVTKYTKVTKVQINTTKEMEIKEESKAERKIERIVEKDDVAITRMYHYQSNSASQSYSVRMETTYKPVSRSTASSSIGGPQRSGPIPSPHVMGAVMPTRQSYYNYQNRPGALASQSYPVNRNMQPVMGLDQHMARHYGNSAFQMPHYGHAPPVPYPHGEYGYYQPAGPMIQPIQDQYVVHKPVPYHPHSHSQLHQAQSPVQSPSPNCDRYPVGNPPAPPFSCHSDAAMKSAQDPASAKCSDPSRLNAPSSHPAAASSYCPPPGAARQHGSHSGSVNRDVPPQSRATEHHAPPQVSQKHCTEKLETARYRGPGRRSYMNAQQMPPYSSAGYRSYPSPVYMAPPHQQAVSMHREKGQHMFRCQERTNEKHMQYHPPHPQPAAPCPPHPPQSAAIPAPQAAAPLPQQQQQVPHINVSHKRDLPRTHENTYQEREKYPVKCDEAVGSPVMRNIESQNSDDASDPNHCLWRPPLVVDIDNDIEPRNTKTYIELDVPKACPQEKIVVVDVDKEEKERATRKQNALKIGQYQSFPNKSSTQPEIIELDSAKVSEGNNLVKASSVEEHHCSSSSKDTPDIMFVEMTKKKEPSALIRRARLHGKQRTYRDAENRPLAPYSSAKRNSAAASEVPSHYQKVFQPQVSLPRLVMPRKLETRITHGWSWEGKPSEKLVYVSNDDPPFLRLCYPAIRHQEGDVIKVRDCVLLKSGARKTDLPFIAKITALWENPADGEMTMSLLWYYRPEHTEPGRKPFHTEGEIFASKHCDTNSVACIEDKCYVLTFGEYCRYRKHCKMLESTCESPVSVVPPIDDYPRKDRLPPSYISPEMVFVCRKVYDFRQKRILKNPV